MEMRVYLGSEFEGLVSYGEDIAKGTALVCGDGSMNLIAHICLNNERKEGEDLSFGFLFFPTCFVW